MRIALLSDSHGETARLTRALEVLATLHVDVLVHCGDIESLRDVALLGTFPGEVYLVAGNMDRTLGERLETACVKHGVQFAWDFVNVAFDGNGEPAGHLVATHSHDPSILTDLILGQQFPYVIHGHSHCQRDVHIGAVRVINPGALYDPRDGNGHALAILDTQNDTLETKLIP